MLKSIHDGLLQSSKTNLDFVLIFLGIPVKSALWDRSTRQLTIDKYIDFLSDIIIILTVTFYQTRVCVL